MRRQIIWLIKNILLSLGVVLSNNRKSKILYYHDIHDGTSYTNMSTELKVFQSHIKTLRKLGYMVVTNINNANNQVAIMFDDGFHGIYDCREYFYTNNICPTVLKQSDIYYSYKSIPCSHIYHGIHHRT